MIKASSAENPQGWLLLPFPGHDMDSGTVCAGMYKK